MPHTFSFGASISMRVVRVLAIPVPPLLPPYGSSRHGFLGIRGWNWAATAPIRSPSATNPIRLLPSTSRLRKDCARGVDRELDPGRVDVQMGDGPERCWADHADSDAVFGHHPAGEFLDGRTIFEREDHYVRLYGVRVDDDSGDRGQASSERLGIRVVVGKPVDVVIECVDSGGSDNSCLAHGSAEALLESPGLVDERLVAGENSSDRSSESLREVDPRRIESRDLFVSRCTGRDYRVHEPGAVEMCGESGVSCR